MQMDISHFFLAVAGRENRVTSSYRNSFGHSIDAACGQLFAGYEEVREFMSQRWTKKLHGTHETADHGTNMTTI